ncbi:Sec16p [Sugiyamaella lignohabitans]|uniref:COPII coat assembly protein SEC16 n=1 Tax=Sugiyamaella lignohabitans TaxID=796027 RepID=A0A167CZN2_9ASCO|nr:Sec16p [Sugiyamaella lignohabitans]ANB12296.1 Sec16p [Sugiyamaella lignohabitans]
MGDDISADRGFGRDLDSILMSEMYEFILISHPPEVKSLNPFSHLLPYKLQHAFSLADFGYTTEVQKLLEPISKATCKEMPKFGEVLDSLMHRVSALDGASSGSSGWFGGKLARPKFDKIMMQSFNKFVAGDDDTPVSTNETAQEGGIFKRLASTPANVTSSAPGSSLETSPNYFNQQPYAASQRQASQPAIHQPNEYAPIPRTHSLQSVGPSGNGTISNEYLNRVQSHANVPLMSSAYAPHAPHAPLGSQAPLQPLLPANGVHDITSRSAATSPNFGLRKASAALSSDTYAIDSRPTSPAAASVGTGPYSRRSSNAVSDEPVNSVYAPPSRTGSSQSARPVSRPFTPEAPVLPPPTKPVDASPVYNKRETPQVSPKSNKTLNSSPSKSVHNPYAVQPSSGSSGSVSNPYNPYAPQTSQPKLAISRKHVSSPYEAPAKAIDSLEESKSEEQEEPVATASYGYNPYGAIYGGEDVPATAGVAPSEQEGDAKDQTADEARDERDETRREDEILEEENGREEDLYSSYEPPSYGFQAEPIAEDNFVDPEASDSYYTPAVAAPAFSAPTFSAPGTSYRAPPTAIPEEDEEDEDLGFANAKKKSESEDSKEKEDERDEEDEKSDSKTKGKETSSDGKKGWFSGWFKKGEDDGQPKAVRAKLGEESSFYYDQELKRWVNKKAPLDNAKPAAPAPPPKSSKPSAASTPGIPSPSTVATPSPVATPPIGGERAASAPVRAPPGMPGPSSLSGGPSLSASTSSSDLRKPSPSSGGGLDDLLASVPTTRKPAKRSARNRYVDIMAQK